MGKNISQLVLDDREKRYHYILELLKKYNLPVLCGKINYPGNNKNTVEAINAFKMLVKVINNKFSMSTVFSVILEGFDGMSVLLVINMEPVVIKKIAVDIEESNELGRIYDIDVYTKSGTSIDREIIGLPPRRCIICGDNARICVRSGKHSLLEIIQKINEIINNCGDRNEYRI